MTPKERVFKNVILEFLEFCSEHPEISLDLSCFNGKENE